MYYDQEYPRGYSHIFFYQNQILSEILFEKL